MKRLFLKVQLSDTKEYVVFEPVLADGFKISVDSGKIKKVIIKKENDK